jgi:hypothetical protein
MPDIIEWKICPKHNIKMYYGLCKECEREFNIQKENSENWKICELNTISQENDELISEVQELKDKLEFECNCWNNEIKIKDSKIEKLLKENEELKSIITSHEDLNNIHLKQIEKLQNEKKIIYEDLLESNKKAETSHKNSLDRLDKIIILMKENARLKLILNNKFNYKED